MKEGQPAIPLPDSMSVSVIVPIPVPPLPELSAPIPIEVPIMAPPPAVARAVSEVKAKPAPEVKPETKTEAKPKAESKPAPETKSELKSDSKPAPEPKSQSKAEPESDDAPPRRSRAPLYLAAVPVVVIGVLLLLPRHEPAPAVPVHSLAPVEKLPFDPHAVQPAAPVAEPLEEVDEPRLLGQPPEKRRKATAPAATTAPPAASPDVEAAYRDGTRNLLQGKFQAASTQFQEVLRQDDRHAGALRGLGFALIELGNRSDAKKHLERYLRLYPGAADASTVRRRLSGVR